MMARRDFGRVFGAGMLGVLATALSGCGPGERLHYKMTIVIDTSQGTKIGTAVREVKFSPKSGITVTGALTPK